MKLPSKEKCTSSIATRGRATAMQRTRSASDAIQKAKALIERDFERNHGIYPYNAGSVTATEVLRRAGLERTFLAKPRHRELRDDVNVWVKAVQKRILLGAEVIRRAVTEQKDAARAEADAIRQRWAEAELEYVDAQVTLEDLRTRCAALEAENAKLRALTAGKNIISIRSE